MTILFLLTTANLISYRISEYSANNLMIYGGILLFILIIIGAFRIIQLKLLLKESDKEKIPFIIDYFVKTKSDSVGSLAKLFFKNITKLF